MLGTRKLGRQGLEVSMTDMRIARLVQDVAEEAGASAAQVELGSCAPAMTSSQFQETKRRGYLEDNLVAADLVLTADQAARLDGALGAGGVSGARYNDHDLSMLNR